MLPQEFGLFVFLTEMGTERTEEDQLHVDLSTYIDSIWFISNFLYSVANKQDVIGCLEEGGMAIVVS